MVDQLIWFVSDVSKWRCIQVFAPDTTMDWQAGRQARAEARAEARNAERRDPGCREK